MKTKQEEATPKLTAALVRKAMKRNPQALEALCKAKMRPVMYICTHITGNKHDGEDLAQEVLMRMYKDIHKLRQEASLDAWLYRIVLTEYYRMLNKQIHEREFSMGQMIDSLVDMSQNFMPDEYLEDLEKREAIIALLNQLPFKNKLCMLMYYYSEMSYAAIADVMGLTVKDVDNLLHRSKVKMRQTLQSQPENKALQPHFLAMVSGPVLTTLMKQEAGQIPQSCLNTLWETAAHQLPRQAATQASANAFSAAALKTTAVTAALVVTGMAGHSIQDGYARHTAAPASSVAAPAPSSYSMAAPSTPLAASLPVESTPAPIVTLEDMIGDDNATLLRQYTGSPPSQQAFTEFLEFTGMYFEQECAGLYADRTFTLYTLEKQDKLLMVIIEETSGGISRVVFRFTQSTENPPSFTQIVDCCEQW